MIILCAVVVVLADSDIDLPHTKIRLDHKHPIGDLNTPIFLLLLPLMLEPINNAKITQVRILFDHILLDSEKVGIVEDIDELLLGGFGEEFMGEDFLGCVCVGLDDQL